MDVEFPHTAMVLRMLAILFTIIIVGAILWKVANAVYSYVSQLHPPVMVDVQGSERQWWSLVGIIAMAFAAGIVFLAADLIRGEET